MAKNGRLMMATNKCSYFIFSRNKKTRGSEKIELKLYGQTIHKGDEVNFLGVKFDSYLSFYPNVTAIRKKCQNRLNLLKILSGIRWQLNHSTLVCLH